MKYYTLFEIIKVKLGSTSAECFKKLFIHFWPKMCKGAQLLLNLGEKKHKTICVEEPEKCRQWEEPRKKYWQWFKNRNKQQ